MSIHFDMSEFTKMMNNVKDLRKNVMRPAHAFFVKQTPIRSGNARRNTTLSGTTIAANYPYAERLDNGWSKQAPEGMTGPTIEEIQRLVDEHINKVGK